MKTLLKILAILMLVGGLASLVIYLFAIIFSVRLASVAGSGGWLIAYPVFAVLASAAECAAGILAIRSFGNSSVPLPAVLFGLAAIALDIVVFLIAKFPLSTDVSWITWVLSLLVPVLFTIISLTGIRKRG